MSRIFSTDSPAAKAVAAVLLMLAAVSCGRASTLAYDDSDDGGVSHPSEVSVAYLRSLAAGESTVIDKPYSICGRVTATDAYGEYFKTICIEDDTGGVEVLIEGFALYRRFALYDRVRIACHGLALGRYGSRIQLGTPPAGEYAADHIPESDVDRYIFVDKDADGSFEPVAVSIAGLRPEHVGRTVMIAGLSAADAGSSWCATDPMTGSFADTERTVYDNAGNRLTVCLRGECRYAAEPIPDGGFSLCGILEYRASAYALRITNRGIIRE